jgi:hypothetical protein
VKLTCIGQIVAWLIQETVLAFVPASQVSGARSDRDELAKLLRRLELGDVVVVTCVRAYEEIAECARENAGVVFAGSDCSDRLKAQRWTVPAFH